MILFRATKGKNSPRTRKDYEQHDRTDEKLLIKNIKLVLWQKQKQ